MFDDMDDYGQFIELDMIMESNIKKYDDIILPKTKENPYIFVNIYCFIMVCTIFYNIYVSPPFK
jgi:hypothetical protein